MIVLSVMAVANGVMAIYHTRERDTFDSNLHWFGCGFWCAIILTELIKFS